MNQKEIARLAGVSVATVSRVLNNSDKVSEETRKLVSRIIDENAYVQNVNARNLRTARTNSIGFLISNFANPFFIDVYRGMEEVCSRLGYSIIIGNTNEDERQESKAIEQFLSYRVDGIVASFVNPSKVVVDKLRLLKTEILMLDRLIDTFDVDSVSIDNFNGAIQQVLALVNLGHTRIAVIHGTPTDSNGRDRLRGFYEGLRQSHLEPVQEYVVSGRFLEEDAYSAVVALMHLPTPPTAVVTHNNLMCIGAYRAFTDMHIRIPEDVSLIGFDDFTLSEHLRPSISLIDRPVRQMGELAARMIIERISKRYTGPARKIVFPVKLRAGASCAQPKVEAG